MPIAIEDPVPMSPSTTARTARVAVVRTRPETVLEDYAKVAGEMGLMQWFHFEDHRLDDAIRPPQPRSPAQSSGTPVDCRRAGSR